MLHIVGETLSDPEPLKIALSFTPILNKSNIIFVHVRIKCTCCLQMHMDNLHLLLIWQIRHIYIYIKML